MSFVGIYGGFEIMTSNFSFLKPLKTSLSTNLIFALWVFEFLFAISSALFETSLAKTI